MLVFGATMGVPIHTFKTKHAKSSKVFLGLKNRGTVTGFRMGQKRSVCRWTCFFRTEKDRKRHHINTPIVETVEIDPGT